jgi:hypothetical protein
MLKPADRAGDLRAAVVTVLLLHLDDVFANDVEDEVFVREDALVALDLLRHRAVLVDEFFDFEPDELDELQPPDRLGLRLREERVLVRRALEQDLGNLRRIRVARRDAEAALAQLLDRLLARRARANELDHLVDVHDGEDQTFEDVAALLRLLEQEPRPAGDDFLAVRDEVLDQLLQAHRARLTVHQRDVDHAHRDLARRVFVELVDDDLRVGVALEVDDDADLVLPAGFVVDPADVVDDALLHRLGRRFDDRLADDAVGDLVDDDGGAAALLLFLDVHFGAQADSAAAGRVAFDDPVLPADHAAGREVRAGDDLHQLGDAGFGVVDHLDDRVADLAQVVRQQVARHAHRDAGRPVHQKIGELGRQDGRLHEPLVVVRLVVDGVVLKVGQQLVLDLAGAGLGVTHGGGGVAVGGAEVALGRR